MGGGEVKCVVVHGMAYMVWYGVPGLHVCVPGLYAVHTITRVACDCRCMSISWLCVYERCLLSKHMSLPDWHAEFVGRVRVHSFTRLPCPHVLLSVQGALALHLST